MFYLKKFVNSTILGLTFGILLAGYAVFAFSSPTAIAPGGNVTAPVNVGPDAQVKLGGLSIGSLIVDGGIKTGGFTSLPACNASTDGTLLFNKNIKKISVCTGVAWEVFTTGIDFDNDGFIAGVDCNDGNAAVWQYIFPGYPDSDNDGHVAIIAESACSGSSLPSGYSAVAGDDCNDSCATCYPGSTTVTPAADGLDQDCDGIVDDFVDPPDKSCGSFPMVCGSQTAECNAYCGGYGPDYYQDTCPAHTPAGNQHWDVQCSVDFSTCGVTRGCDGWNAYVFDYVTCTCQPAYH